MSKLILKYLILPLILILVSVAIFWWFDLDVWGNIQTARDVIVKNKEALVQRQLLAENLKKLSDQYKEHITDVAKINQIVPTGPEIPNLLVMLEALAGENSLIFQGVDFSLIKPVIGPAAAQAANVPAGLQIVQMGVKLKGSYPGSYLNFLNYLKAIENNIRLFDTSNVTFNVPPTQKPGQPVPDIEYSLIINAYYQ